jgi:hypothetical protein
MKNRVVILLLAVGLMTMATLIVAPHSIPQDQRYHDFADTRAFADGRRSPASVGCDLPVKTFSGPYNAAMIRSTGRDLSLKTTALRRIQGLAEGERDHRDEMTFGAS